MKLIFKSLISAIFLFFICSCENEKDPVAIAGGVLLKVPVSGSDYTLLAQDQANDVATLEWDLANNGSPSVSSYTIEVARSGTNFAEPIIAVLSSDIPPVGTYTWTVGYLNTLLVNNGFGVCETAAVDVRVKSTLGTLESGTFIQYSNVITINVTTYSTALPLLSFATASQDPATAPKLAASSLFTTDYEGYMWLTPGFYKFYQADICNSFESPTIYGDDNSLTFDTLILNGQGYEVLTAAYYLVKANLPTNGTDPLTYSVRPITWNFFGDAKPSFSGGNTPLTYDAASGIWKTTFILSNGYPIKYRSNLNTFILGNFDPTKIGVEYGGSILSYNGGNLLVPGARTVPRVNASYTVTLDLSSPRNYKYSIIANP